MQNGGKKCKLTRKSLDGCRTAGYNDRVKSESAFAGLFRRAHRLDGGGRHRADPLRMPGSLK